MGSTTAATKSAAVVGGRPVIGSDYTAAGRAVRFFAQLCIGFNAESRAAAAACVVTLCNLSCRELLLQCSIA